MGQWIDVVGAARARSLAGAGPVGGHVQVGPVHGRASAAPRRRGGRAARPAWTALLGLRPARSVRRSSCATTCSACSAIRRSPASRSATTCARASPRCCWPSAMAAGRRRRSATARPRRRRRPHRRRGGRDAQRCSSAAAPPRRSNGRSSALVARAVDALDRCRMRTAGVAERSAAAVHAWSRGDSDDAPSGRASVPAWAAWRRRATWPGGAGTSWWSSAATARAAGPDARRRDGYRFDTGPTVLTMPDLLAATFAAAGADMDDFVTLRRLDPMYRACFADGSELLVRAGAEAMREEIRAVCGRRRGRGVRPLLRLAEPALRAGDAELPRPQLRPPARPRPPVRGRRSSCCGWAGFGRLDASWSRARSSDERLQRLFSFQAMYAGLAPQQALAVLAVITYMDVVAGVWFPTAACTRSRPAWPPPPRRPASRFRYGVAVERIVLAGGDRRRGAGRRAPPMACVAADVVVCNADLPVATASCPGLAAAAPPARGRTARRRALRVARRRARPARPRGIAHHNIHFGRASGHDSFRALIDDGVRMPDPSTARHRADARRAGAGARRARSVLYVLEPVPNLDGRVDWADRAPAAPRTACAAHAGRARLPRRTSSVAPGRPPRLGPRRAWSAARRSRSSHRFFQTGPFRPANVERRAPGLVFVGCGTVPGVGVPMVLAVGAARRRPGRRRGRRVTGDRRRACPPVSSEAYARVPRASPGATAPRTTGRRSSCRAAPRHHVLRALRLLPLRRRHRRRPR